MSARCLARINWTMARSNQVMRDTGFATSLGGNHVQLKQELSQDCGMGEISNDEDQELTTRQMGRLGEGGVL